MDINQKNVLNMLAGMGGLDPRQKAQAENMMSGYQNKSEQELMSEILQLKRSLQQDPVKYRKQVAAIKSLRGMAKGPQQQQRLDMLIQLLERD